MCTFTIETNLEIDRDFSGPTWCVLFWLPGFLIVKNIRLPAAITRNTLP